MIGRGTRLRPDLFGPGKDKELFQVFDFCQNFEFFNQNPELAEGSSSVSLAQRLFATRVELITELDEVIGGDAVRAQEGVYAQADPIVLRAGEPGSHADLKAQHQELRSSTVAILREEVQAMNLDNFIVRSKRRYVEKYANESAWVCLGIEERTELVNKIAGLPSSLVDDDIAARQFDLMVLRTQLALLRADPSFNGHRSKMVQIANLLEEMGNVPMIAREITLILEIQTDEYWQGINTPMLETARRRLRSLVKLIEVRQRATVYTDFEDEIGQSTPIPVPGVSVGTDMDRFRAKARYFLNENASHIAILKLRRNEPLTPTDLSELERIFVSEGTGPDELDRIRSEGGFGLFVRSLIGMDRQSAKDAFASFLLNTSATANQIEFVNMIIDHLTERGTMDPRLLHASPFTDIDPLGVAGVFGHTQAAAVIEILLEIHRRAAA